MQPRMWLFVESISHLARALSSRTLSIHLRSGNWRWHHMHQRHSLTSTVELGDSLFTEFHHPCDVCMDRPVFTDIRVFSWSKPVAFLANKYLACIDRLTPEALYTAVLRITVSHVAGRATGFLMCHIGSILRRFHVSARKNSQRCSLQQ